MKKLYIKIILFCLPVFVVWASLEFFYRTVATNYTYKTAQIETEYKDIETLLLGDSHTFFGLNPDYFSAATFNLGNISQSLYFDELLLGKHLENLPNLKTVVLNVSYFSLSAKDNSKEDSWRKYFYDQQMDLDVPIVAAYDPKKYSLALARRFKKSAELVHTYFEKGAILSCYPNGYGKQDESDVVSDKNKIAVIIAKKHEDESLDFANNTKRLQRMIMLCKERNVRVVLLEMPVYSVYYGLLNANKKQEIKKTLSGLASNSQNTSYLDWNKNEAFLPSDFRDADHLTNEGAEKCSRLLDGVLVLNN